MKQTWRRVAQFRTRFEIYPGRAAWGTRLNIYMALLIDDGGRDRKEKKAPKGPSLGIN